MAPERKSRQKKRSKVAFVDAGEKDNTNGTAQDEIMEKDETEDELERILFGDSEGFHSALKEREQAGSKDLVLADGSESAEGLGEGGDSEDDLANVPDEDLFYLDAGDSAPVVSIPKDEQPAEELQVLEEPDVPAAWEDSDDDRIRVSLADNERLRKLRLHEGEDVIGGREYIARLRRQFERLQPAPEWASPAAKRRKTEEDASDISMDEDEVEEDLSAQPLAKLLQNIGDLTKSSANDTSAGKKRKLRQGVLDIQRLKDVGGNQPSSIDSLSFHPHYPLLLSSGPASTLFLHHISPDSAAPNPLLTSLHIRHTPIRTSTFDRPTGNRILCSGRRRFFHVWNLDTGKIEKVVGPADRKHELKSMEYFKVSPCGRWIGFEGTTKKGGGVIIVFDANTMQWVAQVRIDGQGGVADFAWWSDGEGICVVGKNGEVSEWDIREKRIIARWVDEGAVGTTVLSLGGQTGRQQLGGDRWVAIGSSSGIVNIYDRKPWADAAAAARRKPNQPLDEAADVQSGVPRRPKPVRVLDQLTTPISHLVFAQDGQFMVMASRWKRDALRLVHLPSCMVYSNWPTSNTPFGRISSVAVSPTSDSIAVANEQGKIRLWEIHG
ncbi:Small nucleolar ribonucleoprotein complex subunit [Trichophyton interdigitale]|uniref:Small nucleolar ribonucleo protein complex subunit n=1 Tax=Trichophyton interdigitale TaxID=101480 RepID=A0A9P5CUT0_9EURO|nr:Small nucleolar ribonucleoprotein complex subunit [Trichophyton interdigitale]KAF3894311.1 Small nucleolar ribonucleoprotein complex subunit [Trichophyton interdigitale]KAG8209291.1 Small nucleolar ribonucleoprotein complex subunit [Trichophyton interdigitale]